MPVIRSDRTVRGGEERGMGAQLKEVEPSPAHRLIAVVDRQKAEGNTGSAGESR